MTEKLVSSICFLLNISIVTRMFHEKKEVSKFLGDNLKLFCPARIAVPENSCSVNVPTVYVAKYLCRVSFA